MLTSVDLDKLHIVHHPEPVLREHCRPVSEFGAPLRVLVARMFELMHEGKGIGLAAPQVGLAIRMFVCNHTGNPEDDRVYVNPELTALEGSAEADEGCLSLPEVTVPMRRAQSVTLIGCDVEGKALRVTGTELEARVWLHETDHLDGRMIIDNMPTSAELSNRRILKQLEADYRARKRKKRRVLPR